MKHNVMLMMAFLDPLHDASPGRQGCRLLSRLWDRKSLTEVAHRRIAHSSEPESTDGLKELLCSECFAVFCWCWG